MNKIILTLLMIFSLSLFGCELGTNSDLEESRVTSSYIGGNTGLTLQFLPEEPPENIYDQSESSFNVVVQVENEGEYDLDVDEAQLEIIGIDLSEIKIGENSVEEARLSNEQELRGKSITGNGQKLDGDRYDFAFRDLTYIPTLSANIQKNIRALLTYKYKTKGIVTNFCIKKEPLQIDEESCVTSGKKNLVVSSAPVSIENFNQYAVSSNKIEFTFDIVKKGSGEIYNPNVNFNNIEQNDERKVQVTISGLEGIECNGLNNGETIQLYSNGRAQVRCQYETDNAPEKGSEEQIVINLRYTYQDSIDKTVKIIHINQ